MHTWPDHAPLPFATNRRKRARVQNPPKSAAAIITAPAAATSLAIWRSLSRSSQPVARSLAASLTCVPRSPALPRSYASPARLSLTSDGGRISSNYGMKKSPSTRCRMVKVPGPGTIHRRVRQWFRRLLPRSLVRRHMASGAAGPAIHVHNVERDVAHRHCLPTLGPPLGTEEDPLALQQLISMHCLGVRHMPARRGYGTETQPCNSPLATTYACSFVTSPALTTASQTHSAGPSSSASAVWFPTRRLPHHHSQVPNPTMDSHIRLQLNGRFSRQFKFLEIPATAPRARRTCVAPPPPPSPACLPFSCCFVSPALGSYLH